MKKGKKIETPDLNLVHHPPLMEYCQDNAGALAVSHKIQDEILQEIAVQMWEKELLSKYRTKYASNYSMMFGGALQKSKFDDRNDDRSVTPKHGANIEHKQKLIIKAI